MSEKKSELSLAESSALWEVLELEDAVLGVIRGSGLTDPIHTNKCDVNGSQCNVNPNSN